MIQRYANFRVSFWLVGQMCFAWLALTTGIMVYSAFNQGVMDMLGPAWHFMGIVIVVAFFHFIIDYGLPTSLKGYWRNKHQLKTTSSPTEDVHRYRVERGFLRVVFWLLILRFLASGLSSYWSGGVIGDLATEDFNEDTFIQAVASIDSTTNARVSTFCAQYQQLLQSESARVKDATLKGDQLVESQILSGNPHQVSKYRKEPGFFYPPPPNKYFDTNLAYGERIAEAEAKKESLIAAELDKTLSAKQACEGIAQQNTDSTKVAEIAAASSDKRHKLQKQEATNTRFVILSDFLAAFIGIIMIWLEVRIELVTGEERDNRSIAYYIYEGIRKIRRSAFETLEEALDLDLDRDGHIGAPGKAATGSTPAEGSLLAKLANKASSVDTRSYTDSDEKEQELEAKVWLSHYRDAKSRKSAVSSHPGYTESSREEAIKQHDEEIAIALNKLRELGYEPKMIKRAWRLIPISC